MVLTEVDKLGGYCFKIVPCGISECSPRTPPSELPLKLTFERVVKERTWQAKERIPNPQILQCNNFKNHGWPSHVPWVLAFPSCRATHIKCMQSMKPSIPWKPLTLPIASSLAVSSTSGNLKYRSPKARKTSLTKYYRASIMVLSPTLKISPKLSAGIPYSRMGNAPTRLSSAVQPRKPTAFELY